MPHLLAGENLAIATTRLTKDAWSAFSTRRLMTHKAVSRYDIGYTFPLYLYPKVGKTAESMFHRWPADVDGRRPNLAPDFVHALEAATDLTFEPNWRGDVGTSECFGAEDVLAYIYAVFHAPEYRRRFEPMLKLDFPRVPPVGSAELFVELAKRGRDLLALHLLESARLRQTITKFVGGPNPEVEKVTWSKQTVWIDGAQTTGFQGVTENVWNYDIGGYRVCEKWLKDRKSRRLSKDDIAHYQKIVIALAETIRLMKEIDEVIEQHGGWPGAFQTGEAKAATSKVVPFRPCTVEAKPD
jgi:predicted helicase